MGVVCDQFPNGLAGEIGPLQDLCIELYRCRNSFIGDLLDGFEGKPDSMVFIAINCVSASSLKLRSSGRAGAGWLA